MYHFMSGNFCTISSIYAEVEEGMATHSSILAWRIPWTEEPGGLQAQGRKESDTTEATQHACTQSSYAYKALNIV